ncbi:hypothetical protein F5148DRAFT_1164644 [Russula earlei]|uniref:Uncharacterized protein n=1 Tax=Russula earlei TaxID=71964 RepID=A0ACC0UKK7_9AGAM|nr:hypothetical protein F5148DRAFT_1164644 [Russula earlei]
MGELRRHGSRTRKGASQNHDRQQTLFDHFLVTRKSTPAPIPVDPNNPSDDEHPSQTIAERTGTKGCHDLEFPEMSPAEHADDMAHTCSYPSDSSIQDIADNIGQSQEECSVDHEHIPPLSPYDLSSAGGSSQAYVGLVAGSDSTEAGMCSSASSQAPSREDCSHVIDLTVEEGTSKAPISIEESPIIKSGALTLTSADPIPFQPFPLGKWKQCKDGAPAPPFPNASTQHIRGSFMRVQPSPINFARGRRRVIRSPLDPGPRLPFNENEGPNVDRISVQDVRSRRVGSSGHQADMNAVLNHHADLHPAISSIFGLASELHGVKEAPQQHWSQKWRPRRAEHILGNEKNACYLREWMHALRLHFDAEPSSALKSTKQPRGNRKKRKRAKQRPEIVREVTRKRKKAGDLDGWLIDGDDDDEDNDCSSDFDDWSLPSSCDPRGSPSISFGKKIRNTILLVGPHGCGKTAAVYACVEELGWNVFEVHPGLGKRGGTHLDDLIGNVGKNHTLPQPLPFQRGRSEPPSPVKRRSTNPVGTVDGHRDTELHPQSAVLIEEADVVFADEPGFWPSVVSFIRDCRRPVIITCNDVSLIPVETLPLQTTLTFNLPPMSLTRPLLSAICQVEGRSTVELEDTSRLEGLAVTADLRRHISQCQLGLADSGYQSLGQRPNTAADVIFSLRVKAEIPAVMKAEQEGRRNLCILQQSLRGADLASYLDACVLLSEPHALEVADIHPDDPIGYKVMKITQRAVMPVQPEYYSRDVDVATAALRSFEGVVERCFPSVPLDHTRDVAPWPNREQYRSQLWEGLKTDPALEGLVDLPRLYLDYRPLIGMMVTVEDKEMERVTKRVKGRSRRLTQNSQKRQDDDVRWLNATERLRGAVRAGELCCSW